MTDQINEALAWWDEDSPGKPWYMDPAKELWERRGEQDEWGRITTDAIYILLHVRERLEPVEKAARAYARNWITCPTCNGSAWVRPPDNGAHVKPRGRCPDCVDGLIPSAASVERGAQPLADNDGIEVLDWHRDLARAVLLASRREGEI